MTGIILDWRTFNGHHNTGDQDNSDLDMSPIEGCDGVVINGHADGLDGALDAGLQRGVDVFVLVSQGDDDMVQRLRDEKGNSVYFACDAGLTETARLRDLAPSTQWVPLTDVYKVPADYSFVGNAYQAGFKTFQLNPGSYEARRVRDSGLLLGDWVARAKHLGFERVWIDSSEAEAAQKGFDLIAARRTSRDMEGRLWVSGGGSTLKHVQNVLDECCVGSIVVGPQFLADVGVEQLRSVVSDSSTEDAEQQAQQTQQEQRADGAEDDAASSVQATG